MSAIITQVNAGTEKGVGLLNAILKKLGRTVEPLAVPLLSKLLHLHADRSQATRDLAASCAITIASTLCPQSFRIIFPVMMDALAEEDWRIKVGVLELLKVLATRVSKQLSPLLPQLIPQVSECMVNSKKQVQVAGIEAMTEACKCISNEDIHHLVPQLVSVIARPEDSPRTLDLLLETTFVANVDAPTLALIAPLLGKTACIYRNSFLLLSFLRLPPSPYTHPFQSLFICDLQPLQVRFFAVVCQASREKQRR